MGPFARQASVGARVIHRIGSLANADFLLNSVGVVTFSSGINDANAFLSATGKNLPIRLTVNQDPAHGVSIGSLGGSRKQYLSGYTTGGPRPTFEYMPEQRWKREPRYQEMKARLGREYLHTWAVPTYTLAMALHS